MVLFWISRKVKREPLLGETMVWNCNVERILMRLQSDTLHIVLIWLVYIKIAKKRTTSGRLPSCFQDHSACKTRAGHDLTESWPISPWISRRILVPGRHLASFGRDFSPRFLEWGWKPSKISVNKTVSSRAFWGRKNESNRIPHGREMTYSLLMTRDGSDQKWPADP